MKSSTDCIHCILKKADALFEELRPGDPDKIEFVKDVCRLLADAPMDATAPELSKIMLDRIKKSINPDPTYKKIKEASNRYMLEWESRIKDRILSSEDPILEALQYAMLGNFIDFGAMEKVDMEQLTEILEKGNINIPDLTAFPTFLSDLKRADKMVYLLDNAGEIVLDKVFMEILMDHFPALELTAVVRGSAVYNDATMEDAAYVRLSDVVRTVDNGGDYPGTQWEELPETIRSLIDEADLILAKGQGNFESLQGCGKNIFYAFLCKCDLFTSRFGLEKFTGVFVHEKGPRLL
ncbi:DUF89 family protein [Alkalibacter rhizosphaerae]|uniref:DUF89 family protein n=1 Tax=Alkalibacter rhizosphaerae TaxID=2815577 RepID=A0A974XET8_9FIRM|nr:ARMT1-like domain-containing protein [Alkalibacter rhizosphaerae]QSX08547.1 DUF89 family protein [Alkalibacter rhizosphaerae]